MEENTLKTKPMTDENEFKDHLGRIENDDKGQKPTENVVNTPITPTFNCPDFVLDFLQDKPIAAQKVILTAKLTQAEKKAVDHIFQASEHELFINRAALKKLIEKLAVKYPEMQPWLTNESIFLGTFAFGFWDRSQLVKSELELLKLKEA